MKKIWLLGPIALYILCLHYNFLVSDQAVYFISPLSSLYDNFALNDWFTWNVSHWHISFSKFVIFYSKVFGVEFGTFIVFVVMIAIFCWVSYQFVLLYGGDFVSYGLFLALLLFGQNMGLGSSRILPTDGNVVPMDLSMPFILLGFYYALRGKYALAGVFAGIAGLFHVNAFILMGLVFGTYFLLHMRVLVQHRGYQFFLWYFLLSSPTIYFILRDFGQDGSATPEVFSQSFFFLWFHVSAHLWGPSIFAFAGLCQLLIWRRYREKRTDVDRHVLVFSAIIAVLLVVAYICSLPSTYNLFVVRLFLWRFSAVVVYFAYLFLSISAATALRGKWNVETIILCLLIFTILIAKYDYPLSGLLAALLSAYLLLGHRYSVLPLAISVLAITIIVGAPFVLHTDRSGIIASLVVTGILALGVYLLATQVKPKQLAGYLFPSLVLVVCSIALLPLDPNVRLTLPNIYGKYEPAYEELIAWVRAKTRPGELFLINPERRGFTVRTHRGVFVNIKNVPAKGDEIKEWIARLFEVYNVRTIQDMQKTKFVDLDIRHLQSLCRKHSLQYLILEGDPKLLNLQTSEEPVFQNELFYVLKIDPQSMLLGSAPPPR
jgi:hypothetical protein